MTLSIIVPLYNEKSTISQLIKGIENVPMDKQIIIVNDGSTDGSGLILNSLKNKNDFIILTHDKNQGKGAAIKTAIKHIQGDIVVIQDADLETEPSNYLRLIEPIINNKAEVVFTYRLRSFRKLKQFIYKIYFLGSMFQTFVANLLFGRHIHDINSGCKLFKSEVLKNLNIKSDGFDVDQEIVAKVFKKHYTVEELPIMYFPRSIHDGKKIRLMDGFRGLLTLIRCRF